MGEWVTQAERIVVGAEYSGRCKNRCPLVCCVDASYLTPKIEACRSSRLLIEVDRNLDDSILICETVMVIEFLEDPTTPFESILCYCPLSK